MIQEIPTTLQNIASNSVESGDVRASVLVVDDEIEVANVLARGLAHAGYKVKVAHGGREALALLESQHFDLLLTDIHMPELPGNELQRIARRQDPDLAVILITAAQDAKDAVECMREGVFDYIVKPSPLGDVTARVEKALERRRLVLENRDYKLNLEQRVAEQGERLRHHLFKSLEALSHALEAKDENTRNHSVRVVNLVTALAERLCPQDTEFCSNLRLAALFHDIGKIGVPEMILNKPDKLTPEEFARVQKHPTTGEAILRPLLEGEEILSVVRHHHERWDGQGYPDGLPGKQIPLGARIVGVADSYDAMISSRPYRQGMSPAQALQILKAGAGNQWDPEIVAVMMNLAEEGHLQELTPFVPAALKPPERQEEDAPSLKITVRSQWPVIFIRDHLDAIAAARLQFKVEALLKKGRNDIVLDMEQVRSLDTAAVQVLYRMHLQVQEQEGKLVMRDVTPPALALLREAKVAEVMSFAHSSSRRSGASE